MIAPTAVTEPAASGESSPVPRATFVDVLFSEWTKMSSLRSTVYVALATVALGAGLAAFFGYGFGEQYATLGAADRAAFDPTATTLRSFLVAQLAIGVLGMLTVTGEYSTGMIRGSLAAVPRRGRLLAAKVLIVTAVALVLGQITAVTAFLASQPVLGSTGAPRAFLDQPGVPRAVVGMGLFLTLVALYGVALGVLVRTTAGALATLVATNVLVPVIAGILPPGARRVMQFWPSQAGSQVIRVLHSAEPGLGPWAGFALLAASTVALLLAAYAVLRVRNA
jgi:ABC-2 type transport system permease protein